MHKSAVSKILSLVIALGAIFGGNLYAQTPSVIAVTPGRYTTQNAPTTVITTQFDSPLNGSTVTAESFRVYGEQSGLHSGTLNYNLLNSTITFNTAAPFQAGERVTVILTTDITSATGAAIEGFQWSFYIRSLAATAVFNPDSTYTTSSGPHFIGVGQFNADAALDIAIPHSRSPHQATIWQNDGAGNFALTDNVPVGTSPRSLVIADLDADGDLDIAVANEATSNVSILLNNGSGDFSVTSTLTVGLEPNSIAAGDLNSDGLLDLATANSTSNTVSVLINTGGGSFAAETPVAVNGNPQTLFLADFDNDGFTDISVTTSGDSSVAILLNDGSGGFGAPQSFAVGANPRAINGQDFNKDGRIDLVISNRDDNNVSVLFNNGGNFSLPNNYPAGTDPVAIASGDWNGDGNSDFAVSNRLSNDVHVFLNNGAGLFPTSDPYLLGTEPRGLNAGDFNGDGIVDLAAANWDANSLQILFNNFGAGENLPPAVPALTSPPDRASINPNTTPIQLSWNAPADEDGDALHFLIEIANNSNFTNPIITVDSRDNVTGFNPAPPVAQGTGSIAYSLSATLPDGGYFWRVTAWDGLTFGAASPARRFSVDTIAPNIDSVVIDAAAFENWYNPSTTPSVNFGAQYDEIRAQRAEFNLGTLGGLQTLQPIPSGQDQVAQRAVNISAANDGSYPLTVVIFDSAGNQGPANTTIRLDRTAPSGASASSPAMSSNLDFLVSWSSGSDAGSGISGSYTVRVQVDGGPWSNWLTNFQGASSPYTGEDGRTYGFEAAAHDRVGNVEAFTGIAETQTVVDTSNDVSAPGPPINLTADNANPSPWKNTPQFQIQWQEPSDPSGIDQAFYKLGPAPTSNNDFTGSVAGGVTSVQATATQQNGENLYLWFSDGSGNVNFQNNASVALRFDSTPPTGTTANSPAISADPNFTVNWGGTGSDGAGSGLSGFYDVRVKINNGPFTNWLTNFQGESAVYNGENGNAYAFEAAARDSAGNIEAFTGNAETTTTVDITANDVTAPAPPITLTAGGANPSPWQNTPQFQIQWQPPNDPSGIARALYKLGTAPTANFDTTASVRSGNSATVTAAQQDGQNLYIWFQDGRGNVDFRNRGVVQLRYDAAAPVVISKEFPNPHFAPNWFNQSLANEADVEIAYNERHLRRIQLQAPTLGINRDVTNAPSGLGVSRRFVLDIEGQDDGSHKLTFTLTDSAGNSKTDSIRIALDSAPPTGTRANSPDTSGNKIFLVSWGDGSDGSGSGLSGVYDVRVQVNGGPWQNWLTGFTGASNNFTGEDNTTYGFEAAAHDRVGNVEDFNNVAESVTFVDPTFQDLVAPTIAHTPISQVDEGDSVVIRAQISDNNQIAEALLFYKRSGEVSFQSQQMANTGGNNFESILTAAQISTSGVNYFIRATDGTNFSFHPPNNAQTQPYNISVRIAGVNNQGLAKSAPQPGGGSESSYRMISVPLNVQNNTPLDVLADDLGQYDPNVWRLFQYNAASDRYVEHPNVGLFTPGKSFWLIVRDANRVIDSGVGATVPTSQPFTINLVRGWNDIAVPFTFPIDANDVQIAQGNASDVMGPYTYQGQWLLPNQVTVLQPWEGYSYYSENPATLSILPIISETASGLTTAKPGFDDEWHIAIAASSGDVRDSANFLGVAAAARLQRDHLDYLEPPYIANHVSVTFPHYDWNGIHGAFTTDFRPPFDDGQVWSFEVESTLGGQPVALRFENLESLPLEFLAILLDKETLKQYDLRQNSQYMFALKDGESKRKFDLIIGARVFVENSDALNNPAPQTFSLSPNYPNPFNAGTSFVYRVAEPAQVIIKVLNILGQEVRGLVSQRQAPGEYRVHWDGRGEDGREISSGVYLIKMEAGRFRQIRKVALVR